MMMQFRSIQLFCREMTAAINEGKALRDAPAEEATTEEVAVEAEATEAPAKTEEA